MDIKSLAEQYNDYIIDRRRYYHTCPELSGEEKNTRARMALLQVAQQENLVPTDEEMTAKMQERADKLKKPLEEIMAKSNVESIRRNEAIRRAADWVIEHLSLIHI